MNRYALAWFPMVVIAILNGTLREKTYGRNMSELRAHQVSTLLALLFLGSYLAAIIWRWRPASQREAAGVGMGWLVATIVFEFIFGRFGAKHPWRRMLQDYNLLAGRVWLAVPLLVAGAPMIFRALFNACGG